MSASQALGHIDTMRAAAMAIRLEKITQPAEIGDPALRQRAQNLAASNHTRLFRALYEGREVAFVAVDWRLDLNCLILYELFVLYALRNRYFGSRVLTEVERIAVDNGFGSVRLSPAPIDSSISREHLVRWYLGRGYQVDQMVPSEMEKLILNEHH